MVWLLLRDRSRHLYSSFLRPSNFIIPPKTLTLIPISNPFSSSSSSSPIPARPRKKKKKNKNHPTRPFDQSELDEAIAGLPPRFTPSELSAAIARQPHPLLSFHLLTHASHLPRFRPHPSPFLVAIKRLGSARLFPEMDSVASLALSLLPSPFPEPLLNTIIYFYAEARMLSKAIHAFKLLRSSPDPSARPSVRTYNLLFSALLGRGSNSYIHHLYMDTLRCLFRQMLDAGLRPDILTLNLMVRGYVQSLHLNDALRIFHQMRPVYGVDPDQHTYSQLVHGLCSQGRTRNARELYGEMKGKGMVASGQAGNSLVSALAMEGEVEEAVKVVWEMVGMGRAVDGVSCRTVVEEACRQGRVEEAVGLVRELREREVVDGRTCRELLNGIQEGYGSGGWDG